MNNKRFAKPLIAVFVLTIAFTAGLLLYVSAISKDAAAVSSQPEAKLAAVATVTPTISKSPATPTPSPVKSSGASTPGVSAPPMTATVIPDDKIQVGQLYDRLYSRGASSFAIKVTRVANVPLVSMESALLSMMAQRGGKNIKLETNKVVYANGISTPFTATYGAVTIGSRNPSSGGWVGILLNSNLRNCTVAGECSKDVVEVLDHIENRLMWVFDFEQITPTAGMPPCWTPANDPGKPCQYIENNQAVTLVDAKTLTFIGGTSYYKPTN